MLYQNLTNKLDSTLNRSLHPSRQRLPHSTKVYNHFSYSLPVVNWWFEGM